jgi:16S rRNA (cytosine1402-N4)-methyltransferase
LADFGLSSDQIEDRERGFSFQVDGPLDMRMDATRQKLSAAKLLAESSEDQLEKWLREFGEERFSRRIAHAIVYQRRFGNLLRTSQLADLVERTIPRGRQGIHPATRTFQGIRIAVNRELDEISALLEAAPRILGAAGTLACMSFHSLEDRIVKRSFRNECFRKASRQSPQKFGGTPAPEVLACVQFGGPPRERTSSPSCIFRPCGISGWSGPAK